MAKGWEPYGITTEAGKALFTQMNMEQGSAVWGPVGEGVVAVEREVRERIIKLLQAHSLMTEAEYREHESDCNLCMQFFGVGLAIALIKGENK